MSKSDIDTAATLKSVEPRVITDVLKALSNPNRLRIFLLVRDAHLRATDGGELCVGDIAAELNASQSTVSHHLRELEYAGLIQLNRRGKNVFCTVQCHPLLDVVAYLGCETPSE